MKSDPYHNVASIYDRLFESMNRGLRLAGIKMFGPTKGMDVLDVGCGTGTFLELLQRFDCHLYGLDSSPAMLEVAHKRLGDRAKLELGDATEMPYEDARFDLVIAMQCLHEMALEAHAAAVTEMRRVLRDTGAVLLIDFEPGRIQPLRGWISKAIILLSEVAAGREHFRNYRTFMANGGLATLAAQHNLNVDKRRVLAGGTFAIYLANKGQ